MKSARNHLILLGFICQAFSWDDYFLPLFSVSLWVVCLAFPSKPVRMGQIAELGLIWAGIAAGYFLAEFTGKRLGLFVCGYGLTLVQAARLLRPLNCGEKFFSILVACFQIGVASTIILNYRFVFIFLAALILIPRALTEMESETYSAPVRPGELTADKEGLPRPAIRHASVPFRFSWKTGLVIFLVTAAFYVLLPRGSGSGLPLARFGSQNDLSVLDSMLDPASGGGANDDRVLLQIEGEHLSYLRCLALVNFDGEKWSGEDWDQWQALPAQPHPRSQKYEHRRVRVKNANQLGKVLPVDGRTVAINGKFFRNPARNQHRIVKSPVMWNTADNFYEYWTDLTLVAQPMNAREIQRYTAYPVQSERLRVWLDQTLGEITQPLEQARWLEEFFKRNFTYVIGAPRLNRANTADDFIFNQRQGHCERFAAHLALLLRMKGIPSRVVIGYLPNAKSFFTGRYNVRFRDAHAWTEAWFQGQGWVLLDATPAATMDRSGHRLREMLDALDFMWYSKVVALDAPAQALLLNRALHFFQGAAGWLAQNKFVFVLPFLLLLTWLAPRLWLGFKQFRLPRRQRCRIAAEHSYGQMLRLLARHGFHRAPSQTPLEFLAELEKKSVPGWGEVQRMTRFFCATRYGGDARADDPVEMKEALRRLRQAFSRNGAKP